jgi:hypothetical protein
MPGPDLGFDGNHLRNSCGLPTAFLGNLIERVPVAAEHARHAVRCPLRHPREWGAAGNVNCISSTTRWSEETKQTVITIGSPVSGRRRLSNRSNR